jgi:Domain of unknown function (DUF5666)
MIRKFTSGTSNPASNPGLPKERYGNARAFRLQSVSSIHPANEINISAQHTPFAHTILFLLPVLAACGQTAPASTGTTVNTSNASLISGTIQAMSADRSSIKVAGQTLKLSGLNAASVGLSTQANKPKKVRVNGKDSSTKALSVGQKVKVFVSSGEATEIDVDLELRGMVESVDVAAGSLVVAGKTVTVSSDTRFDLSGNDDSAANGSGSLASIKVGDFIEVTGVTDATSGVIAASKLEVKTDQELGEDGQDNHTEFKGKVSGFVDGASTLTLKTVTVNCTQPCVLPAGLKDGDFVKVDGALANDGSLTATRVKLEDNKGGGHSEGHHNGEGAPVAGSSVMLQDDIHKLDATAFTFKLDGFTVDYASVAVSGGTLANDAKVKVEGTLDASNAWLVHASSVTVLAAGEDDEHGGGHGGGDDHGRDDHGSQ